MDSIRVFCDSIKNVVNVSCKCAEAKSECLTNWEDVAVVALIVAAICYVVYRICDTVMNIIKMHREEGVKKIVDNILEEKGIVKNDSLTKEEPQKVS